MKLNLTEEQFNKFVCEMAGSTDCCPENIDIIIKKGTCDDCAECWRKALESLVEKEVEEPLYKCQKCDKESTQAWWNDSTKGHFGINSVTIESPAHSGCCYCCPKCGEVNRIDEIEKVVKENEKE